MENLLQEIRADADKNADFFFETIRKIPLEKLTVFKNFFIATAIASMPSEEFKKKLDRAIALAESIR